MGHISTSKKIILSVLGILLILSLLVGVSYAYYMVSVSQTNKNIVKSSCLNLSISNEENVIKLEKQIPIMNEEGKKLTPYTFTINNTCNSMMGYSLNLEELEGSTLASKYIMTMVNDKSYINMTSLSSTDNYYDSSVESRVLATGSLGPNASINYSLRLWMDEATPMTTDAMNKSFRSKVVVVATPTKSVDFDYTGTEQVFTAPASGTYKLETWGAQGGDTLMHGKNNMYGGYGSYSLGLVNLEKNERIFLNVGGAGDECIAYEVNPTFGIECSGGYNGGGSALSSNLGNDNAGTGGGATHISLVSGLLSSLENNSNDILIVSGGGGGSYSWKDINYAANGGHAGGYKGVDGYMSVQYASKLPGGGGTQTSAGTAGTMRGDVGGFGHGGDGGKVGASGGGGGFYGGGASAHNGSGGGSGYIGNSLLTNKAMYCYNCEESSEESTKTISTTCAEETPTSNCAKKGNGYARITYIG